MTPLWNGLFASPHMGRRLASTFREAGAKFETGTIVLNEMEPGDLRKVYRLSLEAIRQPVLAKGLATEDEFEAHLEEMKRLELDGESILFKFPDMWVVASC